MAEFVKKDINILMLEDDQADVELTRHALTSGGLSFSLTPVASRDEFMSQLDQKAPDLLLLDYSVPTFDGLAALETAREKCPQTPAIFVTGTLGEEVVIEMLKSGATDYVLKTRLSRLVPAVQRAMREAGIRSERKRAEDKLRRSLEQLRALSVYLQYVREDERIRISRQVHDELGQALTGLKMDLYWLAHRLPKKYRLMHEKTKAMSAHIDATIQTVRRIATELRPGILDDLGLVPAIEWQAQEFEKRTGIQCQVNSELKDMVLDQDLNTAFFRIFQETLTNIIRHAQATRVEVSIRADDVACLMEVKDNGRGISEAEINDTRSIGLLGMRERAALLDGELSISGAPGQGTSVLVRIPLARAGKTKSFDNEDSNRRRPRHSSAWLEADTGRRV